MSVDAGVAGCASQVLVLPVRDVEVRLGVAVLLRETEVDDVNLVAALADTHQEVVGLDVTVDEVAGVDVLNTGDLQATVSNHYCEDPRDTYQLVGKEEYSLKAKLAVAEVEKILERRAEKVEDHGIVIAFGAKPPDEGNTNATSESLVDLGLIFELGVLSLDRFELDGDFLAGNDVDAEVDIA